jgi:hypothetical protein
MLSYSSMGRVLKIKRAPDPIPGRLVLVSSDTAAWAANYTAIAWDLGLYTSQSDFENTIFQPNLVNPRFIPTDPYFGIRGHYL